jgi:hypothetical protein
MAAKALTPGDIEVAVRDLIVAERINLGVEVTVPVAYGDGELVSVVVEHGRGEYTIHDSAFSAMRLSGAGVNFTPNVIRRMSEFAQRYHCQFADGRVFAKASADDVARVVCLVANAARAVADYKYEIRQQTEADFRVIVFDKLREIVGERAHEADEFRGKSGRLYRIPFVLYGNMVEAHCCTFALCWSMGILVKINIFQ